MVHSDVDVQNCLGKSQNHSYEHTSLLSTQALTLGLWVQWPGGPVDLKTYWPPKKITGPPKN